MRTINQKIRNTFLLSLFVAITFSCTPIDKLPVIKDKELENAIDLAELHYNYVQEGNWAAENYPLRVSENFDLEEMIETLGRNQATHGRFRFNQFQRSVAQTKRSFRFLIFPKVTQYIKLHYNVNYGDFTYKEELSFYKNKEGDLVLEGYKVRK